MAFVICGAVPFLLLCAVDELLLRGRSVAKALLSIVAGVLFLFGLIGASLQGGLLFPLGLRVAGWAFGAPTLGLLAVSLLIQIPVPSVYFSPARERGLVTTGMYSVVRHPGVPSLLLVLVSLVFITGSRLLAMATPIWIAADVAHVAWQERYFLIPKYGEGYRCYQRMAPMLVPTPKSIRRALSTVSRRKEVH